MKPLQFSQEKKQIDWLALKSSLSVNTLALQLNEIRKKNPITKQSMRTRATIEATAEALYDYYSILFSPEAVQTDIRIETSQGPAIKDASLLFPTADKILISPKTNFILLPFQFPTYHRWTQNRQ